VPDKDGETKFHDLGLPDEIMHAVSDLGFRYCTPVQAAALPHALRGVNLAGRAQTGTGKTAAFLIAIFTRCLKRPVAGSRKRGTPRALVIAPTRELVMQIAKDAVALAKYCEIRCLAVYGGMDFNKQLAELSAGPVDLLAGTPGRLLDFVRRRVVDLGLVEVLVIDEADRMLDMGFIPDVRRIIRRLPPKGRRCTMLFSATLTREVMRLASQWMPDPIVVEIEPEQVAVETVTQRVYAVAARDKLRLLFNLLVKRKMGRVLVFGNRRDRTRRLAENLRRYGVRCGLLSGAVEQKRRVKVLEDFRAGRMDIVVATDVAARGLHIEGIDHVVNYDLPYEPEDYVHRIGRTGRAGAEGTAISFACEDESFIVPEIEKYIGESLSCSVPEADLLSALPEPIVRARSSDAARPSGGRRDGRRGRTRKKPGRSARGSGRRRPG
jgi:ATP-dependent RNA helicase RhlB